MKKVTSVKTIIFTILSAGMLFACGEEPTAEKKDEEIENAEIIDAWVNANQLGADEYRIFEWGEHPLLGTSPQADSADTIERTFYVIADGQMTPITSYHPGMGGSSWWEIVFIDDGKHYLETRRSYTPIWEESDREEMTYTGVLYALEHGKSNEIWSIKLNYSYIYDEEGCPIKGAQDFLSVTPDSEEYLLYGKKTSMKDIVAKTDRLLVDGACMQLLDFIAKDGAVWGEESDKPLTLFTYTHR